MWAAEGRTDFEGGLAAWTVRRVSEAVWAPKALAEAGDINPYRRGRESDALRAHKAWLSSARLRCMAGGSAGGD